MRLTFCSIALPRGCTLIRPHVHATMSTPPRDGRPVSLDTKLKKHATQFKVYAVSPFHLRSILDQNERRGGRRPMSLLITCEVGGDTIPPWLIPQLHSLNIPKRKRQRKVTRKNAGKAKRKRQPISSANAKNSRTHLGDGLQLESGDDSLSAQSVAAGIKPNFVGPQACLLYTSPSPRDKRQSRMPSSA